MLCKVRRGFFQDVSLFLNATELGSKPQNPFLRLNEVLGSLFLFARPYGSDPFVEAVTRYVEPSGYCHDLLTTLGHLADGFVLEFWRVLLMAHGTPPTGSMLASEASTISGEVQLVYPTLDGLHQGFSS